MNGPNDVEQSIRQWGKLCSWKRLASLQGADWLWGLPLTDPRRTTLNSLNGLSVFRSCICAPLFISENHA